jgi:hypothetical protein
MAYSYSEVTASGGNTFNIPFDYISQAEIEVYVDGVSTPFTFTSSNVIDITPAPTTGATVRVERTTDLTARAVDFASGAVLTEEDLDNSNVQVFHAAQEALDKANAAISLDADGKWDSSVDGTNRVIKNVADPVDPNDAVNRGYITSNLPTIQRVEQSIADVEIVAADLNEATSDIEVVSGKITEVARVSQSASNIDRVHTSIDNLDRVHTSIDNLDRVHTSISNIDTVKNSIANVDNVGNDISNVNAVAGKLTELDSVYADLSKVVTVANDLVESNGSEIETVAGAINEVDAVGTNIANVNKVAAIDTDVTAMVDRYFVQEGQPTTGTSTGDLWFKPSTNTMYVYNGTAFVPTTNDSDGMIRQNDYLATANQTTFTGTDKNGYAMTLVDGYTTFVYQNGILIEPTTDYTIDYSTQTITLVVGATLDDEIRIVSIRQFASLEWNDLTDARDDAQAAQALAEQARDTALSHKNAAAASASAASLSEGAADASEQAAATSENNAAGSAAAALASEQAAATSESNALASANVAASPWVVDSGTQDISYSSGNVEISGKTLTVARNNGTAGTTLQIGDPTNQTWEGVAFKAGRTSNDQYIGGITGHWGDNEVGRIVFETGGDVTNKDDGDISFLTAANSTLAERMRIKDDGTVIIPKGIRNKGVWEYCGEHYQTSDVSSYNVIFANLGCDITKYDMIKLEFMNMGTSASATFNFRYIIDGTVLTAANYRWAATRNYFDGTTLTANTNGGWDTSYARVGYAHDSTVHWTYGELHLPYPSRSATGDSYSNTFERSYSSFTKGSDGSSRPMIWSGVGRHTTNETGDLTGVYLYPSAGNFRNIHVRVFGRLKR